jgi:hypothetical protein
LQRDLPPVGADVVTTTGRARVLAQEILAGQILVETEDMRRIVIQASDILTVLSRGKKRPPENEPGADAEISAIPPNEVSGDASSFASEDSESPE